LGSLAINKKKTLVGIKHLPTIFTKKSRLLISLSKMLTLFEGLE
jgi:hypothetical protein